MEEVNTGQIQHADIIVGIPSYNEADNIAFVTEKCDQGLNRYFPEYRHVIINVDNNSPDGTREVFLNTPTISPRIYISTPPGVKGKGNNFYNLFHKMWELGARAVVVVDADLTSITPEWIFNLADPVISKNFDFITPLYSRNEYDGTITNNICYPLIYGLLGKAIRQPIGGDFALSARLGRYYLQQEWHKTTRQYGIDIFMTLHAITGGFKLGQVGLGAKIHKPSAPKLGPMFSQVVGTLFKTLLLHRNQWVQNSRVETLPHFGNNHLDKPQNLSVDYKNTKAIACYEFNMNREILKRCLSPRVFEKLSPMFDSGKINIGMDLWARITYDLLYAYDTTDANSDLIEAMKPLYFGRVVSFIKQTLDWDHEASEQLIQRQANHFFRLRRYLFNKYAPIKNTPSNPINRPKGVFANCIVDG
ncbi:MAG: glycosyltransferase [Calditrichia bacterium]